MKFTCLTSNLKKALNVCEKITNRNLSLPILNNILIKTFKNQLQLVSTDLELGLNYFVNGEVIEEGEIIIPAKLLLGLISNLKEEKITLETKKDKLYIQTKDFDLNIQGFDSTDFPIIPKIKSEDYLEIESQEFLKTLSQVIKSANAGFNKPELNSVYFHYNKENMFFVSTDSFRLSEKQLNKSSYKFNGDQEIKMIVPIKTINEVMLILQNFEDINDKVKVFFSNNQIFFDFGSVNLISRLIEGEFPNYKNIIPKNFQTKIQIDKNNLIESIKLISLLSSQIKDINIQLDVKKQEIVLKGSDTNKGEGVYRLKCVIEGYDTKMCFNYSYILDGLESINNNEVFVGISEDSPALLKATNDDSFIYVLMPIRI